MSEIFDEPSDAVRLSAFDALESAFNALAEGPGRLAVDGASFNAELPHRQIPIAELRRLLLTPGVGYLVCQRVWQHLISRARTGRPEWMIACCGMALPGLRNLAADLSRYHQDHADDFDAEMLAAFVESVHSIDISTPRIAARMLYAAYNAGRRARYREVGYAGAHAEPSESASPPPVAGHPDFLLARAVHAGLITRRQAELVGSTCLEGQTLSAVASRLNLTYSTAHRQRRDAETVIAEAIVEGKISGNLAGSW